MIGLWNGVQANVARAALLSAGQLSTYDQTKQARSGAFLGQPSLQMPIQAFSQPMSSFWEGFPMERVSFFRTCF